MPLVLLVLALVMACAPDNTAINRPIDVQTTDASDDASSPGDGDAPLDGPGPVGCTPGRVESCPCSSGAAGAQTCASNGTFGACVCPDAGAPDVPPARDVTASCAAGFADCDRNPSNGCETATTGDVANCGACGNRCPNLWTCSRGICGHACTDVRGNELTADCDGNTANGCEVMLGTADNCGGCGGRCDAPRGCSPIRAEGIVTGHACR